MVGIVAKEVVTGCGRHQTGTPGTQIDTPAITRKTRVTLQTDHNLMMLVFVLVRVFRQFDYFGIQHRGLLANFND